jgi:hypothetical protein
MPSLVDAGFLASVLVDSARVYGPDVATDAYDVLLAGPFACRLTNRRQATLGTGIGGVRTSYFHLIYPADVTLPDGYWEMEIAGTRYAPQANSSSAARDLAGEVQFRTVDLDQIGGSLH